MKKYRMILQVIIGIIIIAIILYKIGIYDVVSALKKTNPFNFIMACLAYLCLNLTLASRLSFLLAIIGYKIKFITIFFSHVGGMILSDITPGRSGYFLTPSLLKKKAGTPITDGMACIFAPQAIELILKVCGASAAIIYISSISGIQRDLLISVAIGASILMFAGILMLFISWKDENVSLNFLKRIPFLRNFTDRILPFKEQSIAIKGSINTILLLTVTGWFFAALHWFYLGKALGIELPYYVFFLLHPLLSILMFAPTPAGLGVMELGAIGVLSLFGIPGNLAAAFSILVRASMVLVDIIGLKAVLASLKDIEL
jgi:uncharacterized protein (TIRG00374 family)